MLSLDLEDFQTAGGHRKHAATESNLKRSPSGWKMLSIGHSVVLADANAERQVPLSSYLEVHGFVVHRVNSGAACLRYLKHAYAHLVVLDEQLPDLAGNECCRLIRKHGHNMPIVLVSDDGHDANEILGLEAGATDYVTRPIGYPHFLARARAHLRTFGLSANAVMLLGKCQIHPANQSINVGGQVVVQLSRKETQVIRYLCEARGRPVPKSELLEQVWKCDAQTLSKTVETHLHRLKKKLDQMSVHGVFLLTGQHGYSLIAE